MMTKERNASPEDSAPISTRIRVENVSKVFARPSSKELQLVLKDISFVVKQNDFLVVVGPSGCGKSTLLSIMAGLAQPTSGTIYIDETPVTEPNPKKVSIMFQDSLLLPWRTISQNIELPLEALNIPREERMRRISRYLEIVGLSGYDKFYPRQISGGMKQRVALCRSLAMETDLVLMDEPFGALDEQTRLILSDELVNIWRQVGKTIVFVTHSLSEAVYLGNRVIVLGTRPGVVREIVDIHLDRPRKFADPEFGALAQRLWDELRSESFPEKRR
ncbi:MAG: ABC transporter ATP-binding protein [Nitrososphaerota archaeon]|nr:ABC transporter ATP-binding protein [Nitrososphaerota archaeon]